MKLIKFSDTSLRQVAKLYEFTTLEDSLKLTEDLVSFVHEHSAFSLAAPQVGLPVRVFAMRGSPQNIVCFNPRIVNLSNETTTDIETSLTYPGFVVKIARANVCKVRFQTPNSETVTKTYSGITARIFQQNMNILDGDFFYKDATQIHRQQAMRKWKY